jgi:hypothetical protein
MSNELESARAMVVIAMAVNLEFTLLEPNQPETQPICFCFFCSSWLLL